MKQYCPLQLLRNYSKFNDPKISCVVRKTEQINVTVHKTIYMYAIKSRRVTLN